jgi:hypothetical protein
MNFLHEFILHAVEIFLNTTNALDDAFDVDRKIVIAISSKKKKAKTFSVVSTFLFVLHTRYRSCSRIGFKLKGRRRRWGQEGIETIYGHQWQDALCGDCRGVCFSLIVPWTDTGRTK